MITLHAGNGPCLCRGSYQTHFKCIVPVLNVETDGTYSYHYVSKVYLPAQKGRRSLYSTLFTSCPAAEGSVDVLSVGLLPSSGTNNRLGSCEMLTFCGTRIFIHVLTKALLW